jgi:hypothetical protein
VRIAKSSKEQDGYETPDMTGARLDFPSPSGAREPPCGGDLEIKKAVFGFKRESKNFALIWIALPGRYGRAGRDALTALPYQRPRGQSRLHRWRRNGLVEEAQRG